MLCYKYLEMMPLFFWPSLLQIHIFKKTNGLFFKEQFYIYRKTKQKLWRIPIYQQARPQPVSPVTDILLWYGMFDMIDEPILMLLLAEVHSLHLGSYIDILLLLDWSPVLIYYY